MFTAVLKCLADHPLADFALQVWSDLNRVGIPGHLASETRQTCGPDGVDMSVTEDCLILTWNVPDEEVYEAPDDEGAGLSYSVGILTAAVAGVLASRGHCVCSEAPDPPLAPPLFVYPPASTAELRVGGMRPLPLAESYGFVGMRAGRLSGTTGDSRCNAPLDAPTARRRG